MSVESVDKSQATQSCDAPGYLAFKQYVAIKAHFNQSFDWEKYKGQIKVHPQSFLKRKDQAFFAKLEDRYSSVERNQIFLANFVQNKHFWIGELLTDDAITTWSEWKGRVSRMEYQFAEDLRTTLDEISRRKRVNRKEALKRLIRKPEFTHPLVLRFVWGGMFGLESYLLLSEGMNLKEVYKTHLSSDSLWSDFEWKIGKYASFMRKKLNRENIKEQIKKIVEE